MEALADQVLAVCPQVPRHAVLRDLEVTGSAELTINRIFEGIVLFIDKSEEGGAHDSPARLDVASPDELDDAHLSVADTFSRSPARPRVAQRAKSSPVHLSSSPDSPPRYGRPPASTHRLRSFGHGGLSPISESHPHSPVVDLSSPVKPVQRHTPARSLRKTSSVEISPMQHSSSDPSPALVDARHQSRTRNWQARSGHRSTVSDGDELELVVEKENTATAAGTGAPRGRKRKAIAASLCADLADSPDARGGDEQLQDRHSGKTKAASAAADYGRDGDEQSGSGEDDTQAPPKRRKLTEDEKARIAENREKAKQDRARAKEAAKMQKQIEQERAKAEKLAAREALKNDKQLKKRQESFMREIERQFTKNKNDRDLFAEMTIIIDTRLIAQPGRGRLKDSIQELRVNVEVREQPLPHTITWQRTSSDCDFELLRESGSIRGEDLPAGVITSQVEDESEAVVIVSGFQFVDMARAGTIRDFVSSTRKAFPDKRLAVFVESLETVFKEEQNAAKRAYLQRVRDGPQQGAGPMSAGSAGTTRAMAEEALVSLQVEMGVHVYVTLNKDETHDMLLGFTKSVSLRPIRGHNREFSWCTEGVKKHALATDIWRSQLECFVSLSHDVANAIVDAFPTFTRLLEAFTSAENERKAIDALADVPVVRQTSSRRVGPALAEKIYRMLVATDGSLPMK